MRKLLNLEVFDIPVGDVPLEGQVLHLLLLQPLQHVAVGLEVGGGLHHEEGVRHLHLGQRRPAVRAEAELDLALLQLGRVPVRHRGEQEGLKVVPGHAHQRAVEQPLGVLPAHKLAQKTACKSDALEHAQSNWPKLEGKPAVVSERQLWMFSVLCSERPVPVRQVPVSTRFSLLLWPFCLYIMENYSNLFPL